MWLLPLLKDLRITHRGPTKLNYILQLISYIHERTKHIEIDFHIVREKMQVGFLKTLHVTTHNQLANIFTKAIHPTKFHTLLSQMGVHNLYSPS